MFWNSVFPNTLFENNSISDQGTYAEYTVFEEDELVKYPEELSSSKFQDKEIQILLRW